MTDEELVACIIKYVTERHDYDIGELEDDESYILAKQAEAEMEVHKMLKEEVQNE
jgi:hypothetical protein